MSEGKRSPELGRSIERAAVLALLFGAASGCATANVGSRAHGMDRGLVEQVGKKEARELAENITMDKIYIKRGGRFELTQQNEFSGEVDGFYYEMRTYDTPEGHITVPFVVEVEGTDPGGDSVKAAKNANKLVVEELAKQTPGFDFNEDTSLETEIPTDYVQLNESAQGSVPAVDINNGSGVQVYVADNWRSSDAVEDFSIRRLLKYGLQFQGLGVGEGSTVYGALGGSKITIEDDPVRGWKLKLNITLDGKVPTIIDTEIYIDTRNPDETDKAIAKIIKKYKYRKPTGREAVASAPPERPTYPDFADWIVNNGLLRPSLDTEYENVKTALGDQFKFAQFKSRENRDVGDINKRTFRVEIVIGTKKKGYRRNNGYVEGLPKLVSEDNSPWKAGAKKTWADLHKASKGGDNDALAKVIDEQIKRDKAATKLIVKKLRELSNETIAKLTR